MEHEENTLPPAYIHQPTNPIQQKEQVVPTNVDRSLIEATVSINSPLNGYRISEIDFGRRFGTAVIGIAREGKTVCSRLSKVIVKPGDALLLACKPVFLEQDTRYLNISI